MSQKLIGLLLLLIIGVLLFGRTIFPASIDGYHTLGYAYVKANVCPDSGFFGDTVKYCISGGNIVAVKNIEGKGVAIQMYPTIYTGIPYDDCISIDGTPQVTPGECHVSQFPTNSEWHVSDETEIILNCGTAIKKYYLSDIMDAGLYSPSNAAFLLRVPYTYNWITPNGIWDDQVEIYLDQENPACNIVGGLFILEKEQCTPNWQCGEWSKCVGGLQSRECIDVNNCGTEEGKPIEMQSCEDDTCIYDTDCAAPTQYVDNGKLVSKCINGVCQTELVCDPGYNREGMACVKGQSIFDMIFNWINSILAWLGGLFGG